jgi:hypothetical protein
MIGGLVDLADPHRHPGDLRPDQGKAPAKGVVSTSDIATAAEPAGLGVAAE